MLPLSDRAQALYDQLVAFMDAHVYPAEAVYAEQHGNSDDRCSQRQRRLQRAR